MTLFIPRDEAKPLIYNDYRLLEAILLGRKMLIFTP